MIAIAKDYPRGDLRAWKSVILAVKNDLDAARNAKDPEVPRPPGPTPKPPAPGDPKGPPQPSDPPSPQPAPAPTQPPPIQAEAETGLFDPRDELADDLPL